jgi:hypothetical protein
VVDEGGADLCGEVGDARDDRVQSSDEREHDRSSGLGFELVGAPAGGAAQAVEQLAGGATTAVVVTREKAREPLLTKAARVGRRGVALEKGQRDRAVDVGEDLCRARPEAVQLRAQLIGDRNAVADEVLAGARQGPQRLGRVGVGDQDPETMAVGAGQLGQHERVEAVALAARGAEARSVRGELVGMHRDHVDADVEQPFDDEPVWALDRDERHVELQEPPAQRRNAALVVSEAPTLDDPPVAVDDTDRVFLAGPIDPGEATLTHDPSLPAR